MPESETARLLNDILIGASLLSKDMSVNIFEESDMLDFINGITLPIFDLLYSVIHRVA